MKLSGFIRKLKVKIWSRIVATLRAKKVYPLLYRSFWHYKLHTPRNIISEVSYFAAVPNQGAGIGHQLANWIAGYLLAKEFNLQFAHYPFSDKKWEAFLGFGEHEVSVKELIEKLHCKKVLLPLFNANKPGEIVLIKKIINSYQDRKVVFLAEQDQFYRDQSKVIYDLKLKFYKAKARETDHLIYSKEHFNIALHIRRGDIVVKKENKNPNLSLRWQENDYFETVLDNTINNITSGKPIAVYLFSQGERSNFANFEKYKNIHFCLEMNAMNSFLHMIYADLLITSKSSFSYKPALLNNGIKICPANFWHGFPDSKDFILADDYGNFDVERLSIIQ